MGSGGHEGGGGRRFSPVYLLAAFIPAALVLELVHASAPLVFAAAALGVIPTAGLMGKATEELAARSGPGIGGLLNVTFGNAGELIIATFALIEGLQEVVKASIVGSIIGNVLLVLGAAMVAGGARREHQTFNRSAANAQSAMLLLAVAALSLPALLQLVGGGGLPAVGEERVEFGADLELLSLLVGLVLMASYGAGLLFSLKTHRGLFNPHGAEEEHHAKWSVRRSVLVLAGAGALVALMAELLVASIAETGEQVGLSQFFIGVFVVAVVGNAAEHWVAILVAIKDKMDLAVNIAIGSSAQIALFVAPILVLLSFIVGPSPMALVFNGYEVAAMLFAVLVAAFVTQEGETNWFEGVQLLALYAVLGLVFFFA